MYVFSYVFYVIVFMLPYCLQCVVNRAMSGGQCIRFVAHAWKTDICANCLRPSLKHADHGDVSTSPVQHEHAHSASSSAAVSMNAGTHLSESSKIGAAKLSPVKPKPAVSAKPATAKKPNLTGDQVPVKPHIRQSSDCVSGEHLMPSRSKSGVVNNSSVFTFTEEGSVNSSDGVSDVAHVKDVCITDEKEEHSNQKTFHHYDLYDVTARELNGTPKQPEVVIGTASESTGHNLDCESEQRKFRTLPVSATRVDDVPEEHVAMPYNVVDITLRRPCVTNGDPLSLDPSVSSSSPPAAVGTWPSKPQPAERQIVPRSPPKPRERVSKPQEQVAVSTNVEVASLQDTDGCAKTPAVASNVMSSDLVSERYAHRIYEEIDDLDIEQCGSKADVEWSRQTTSRSSAGKSPAFAAKMAALASLDLGKTRQVATVAAPTMNTPEESLETKSTVASSVQDTIVVSAAKPEKTRKSGGKTFFQKLLKFGSKDTSEAVQSSAVSRTDEGNTNVIECSGSPSCGVVTNDDAVSSSSVSPTQTTQLTEKQAMLMNLKDCLAKRQTSESSEISPIHSRTRSLEPTHLRTSAQSTGSIQPVQGQGSSMEKSEKQAAVVPILEASPVVDSQASHLPIQEQSSSKDVSVSAPQQAGKESDTDIGLQGVTDKKSKERQRFEVKDLTVTTEDAGNADCSLSTCSSDAVSPTPSDLSAESSDHPSLKCKARTDRQGTAISFLCSCLCSVI